MRRAISCSLLVAMILVTSYGIGADGPPKVASGEGAAKRPLKVAISPFSPFVFVQGDAPSGFSVELWETVRKVRELLVERYAPDGFNVGVNDGRAAGQTIPPAHIHVIPRYEDDVDDPRGGIRGVIPEKARYWE